MALGFSTTASFGNRTVVPDRGMGRSNTPIIFQAKFGDGYEQRIANGINNLEQEFTVSFNTRTKAEIDDIVGFFESTKGASTFNFTFPDTNESGDEETVKVYVVSFTQTWEYDDFYSLTAPIARVYEA